MKKAREQLAPEEVKRQANGPSDNFPYLRETWDFSLWAVDSHWIVPRRRKVVWGYYQSEFLYYLSELGMETTQGQDLELIIRLPWGPSSLTRQDGGLNVADNRTGTIEDELWRRINRFVNRLFLWAWEFEGLNVISHYSWQNSRTLFPLHDPLSGKGRVGSNSSTWKWR